MLDMSTLFTLHFAPEYDPIWGAFLDAALKSPPVSVAYTPALIAALAILVVFFFSSFFSSFCGGSFRSLVLTLPKKSWYMYFPSEFFFFCLQRPVILHVSLSTELIIIWDSSVGTRFSLFEVLLSLILLFSRSFPFVCWCYLVAKSCPTLLQADILFFLIVSLFFSLNFCHTTGHVGS